MENKTPLYENLAKAFYFFQFDERDMIFSIFINSSALEKIKELALIDSRLVSEHYIKTFNNEHGINGCAKVESGYGNFTKLSFKLVPAFEITKKKCQECNGRGKKFKDEDYLCWRCHGNGKELVRQWDALSQITKTISSVLDLLEAHALINMENEELLNLYPDQLYILMSSTKGDMGGHALGGTGSNFFRRKLIEFYEKEKVAGKLHKSLIGPLAGMENAWKKMFDAYKFMDVNPYADEHRLSEIHVIIKPSGSFQVQTEGVNSCSMFNNPERGHIMFWIRSGGTSIDCHNVDSPVQQLDLLIGLAGMTEEIFI